jgi:hypothetical protein
MGCGWLPHNRISDIDYNTLKKAVGLFENSFDFTCFKLYCVGGSQETGNI